MQMRLDKAQLQTWRGDEDAFKAATEISVEIHVRAMAGNSGGYAGELTHNCCLYDVIVHHDVPLVTSPNNTYNLTWQKVNNSRLDLDVKHSMMIGWHVCVQFNLLVVSHFVFFDREEIKELKSFHKVEYLNINQFFEHVIKG